MANLMLDLEALAKLRDVKLEAAPWEWLEKHRAKLVNQYPTIEQDLHDKFVALYMRLPPDHPIIDALEDLFEITGKMIDVFRHKIQDVGDKEWNEFLALRDRLSEAQGGFMVASIALVGTKGAAGYYFGKLKPA
jgi:hypothetical protein